MAEPSDQLPLPERLLRSVAAALHSSHRPARSFNSALIPPLIAAAYVARLLLVDGGDRFAGPLAPVAALLRDVAVPIATLPPLAAAVAFAAAFAVVAVAAVVAALAVHGAFKSAPVNPPLLATQRLLLGAISTLPLLFLNVIFEPINCLFISRSALGLCALQNPLPHVLAAFAAVALLLLPPLLFLSALPHPIDPRSYSYAAAVSPYVPFASHAVLLIVFILQRLGAGEIIPPPLAAAASALLFAVLALAYALLQPLLHPPLNHVRAGIASFGVMAALLSAVAAANPPPTPLAIAWLVLAAPAFAFGAALSAFARRRIAAHFLARLGLSDDPKALLPAIFKISRQSAASVTPQVGPTPSRKKGVRRTSDMAPNAQPPLQAVEDELTDLLEGSLSDEEVFGALAAAYARDRPDSLVEALGAAVEEVATRFLCGDVALTKGQVLLAEVLLKRALLRHPQSIFLRVRFVGFLLFVKKDLPRARVRLDELSRLKSVAPLCYVLSALRNALRADAADEDVDDAAAEKLAEAARKGGHLAQACRRHIASFWAALQKGGGESAGVQRRRLLAILERMCAAQEEADAAFEFILKKGGGGNIAGPLLTYARYLKDVKRDEEAAQVAREMAEGATSSRGGGTDDGGSSQHSLDLKSTTSSARGGGLSTRLRAQSGDAEAMRALRRRLAAATGGLLAIVVALFLAFVFLIQIYETDVLKQYAAGARRTLLTDVAIQTRRLFSAARENDPSTFAAARAAIAARADSIWRYTSKLENLNPPDPLVEAAIRAPTARMRVAGTNGGDEILTPPFEMLGRYVSAARAVSNLTMGGVASFSPAQPWAHPDLFFIFSNALSLGRIVDGVAALYQLASFGESTRLRILVGGLCFCTAVLEVGVVLLLFRRAIKSYFGQLYAATDKCLLLPPPVVRAMVAQSASAVRANKKKKEKFEAADGFASHPKTRATFKSEVASVSASFSPEETVAGAAKESPNGESLNLKDIKGGISEVIARTSGAVDAGGGGLSPSPDQSKAASSGGGSKQDADDIPLPGAAGSEDDFGGEGGDSDKEHPPDTRTIQIKWPDHEVVKSASESEGQEGDVRSEAKGRSAAVGVVPPLRTAPSKGRVWKRPLKSSLKAAKPSKTSPADGVAKRVEDAHSDPPPLSDGNTSRRERAITAVYVAVLALILASLAALLSSVFISLDSTLAYAATVNSVGRRRFTSARAMLLALEVNDVATPASLLGGALYELSNLTDVLCHLRGAARYLLMVHNGVLFGGKFGFEELPAARSWPPPSADDACSPLVADAELFAEARPRESQGTPPDAKVFFEGTCLTDVTNLVPPSSVLFGSAWTVEALADFRPQDCLGFASGDAAYAFGLHRMVETFAADALALADGAAVASVRAARGRGMEKLYFGTREFGMGILMSAMFYLNETHAAVVLATEVVGVMFAVVMLALMFQYLFLGNRVSKLLRENAFISSNVQALLQAATAEGGGGYGAVGETDEE